MTTLPYGSWPSPLTPELLAEGGVGLSQPSVEQGVVRWIESRPSEGGRQVLVARHPDGTVRDEVDADTNVRTLVHEYGGGDYGVWGTTIWFSDFSTQRLHRIVDGGAAEPITPEPATPRAERYADLDVHPDGRWVYAVREQHDGSAATEVRNAIVVVPDDGQGEVREVDAGHDFASSPRVSRDGAQLAWLVWDQPRMPWDGTELKVGAVAPDGSVIDMRTVAGGPDESLMQPAWAPDGRLTVSSDRTGWWNVYAVGDDGLEPLAPMDAEVGGPAWQFRTESFAWLADGALAMIVNADGATRLAVRDPDGTIRTLETDVHPARFLVADGTDVLTLGYTPTRPTALVRIDTVSGTTEVLRASSELEVDPGGLSVPEPIAFPVGDHGDEIAYALYYAPVSVDHDGPGDERPPLLVFSHGGPTSQVLPSRNLGVQFWTSRGFAVVDVNYGGSTGYGRPYRERLAGSWGLTDVADSVAAARFLTRRGDVDGDRLAIRGGSAGGWTTLCALTFTDVFAAGCSFFGVADAALLAQDTHKFESRYLDGLIGPWPEAEATYTARSPLHHAEQLSSPMLLLQGLEDAVVPPAQAEAMVAALAERGVPHAYVTFAGEQHGFRRAASIVTAHHAELSFYGQVLGFTPAGDVPEVPLR